MEIGYVVKKFFSKSQILPKIKNIYKHYLLNSIYPILFGGLKISQTTIRVISTENVNSEGLVRKRKPVNFYLVR
jgi:isopentenyl phosphate kinase